MGNLFDKVKVPANSRKSLVISGLILGGSLLLIMMGRHNPPPTKASAEPIPLSPARPMPEEPKPVKIVKVDAYGNPVTDGYQTPVPIPPAVSIPQQFQIASPSAQQSSEDDDPVAWQAWGGEQQRQSSPVGIPPQGLQGMPMNPATAAEMAIAEEMALMHGNADPAKAKPTDPPEQKQDEDVVVIRPGHRDTGKGERYILPEGTWFDTVLVTRARGEFTGPITCMVNVDFYSHDGKHVLIPQGALALGEAYAVGSSDQKSLAITFHRLTYWKGDNYVSIPLDKFHGLDQAGDTGVHDLVNHHWLQTFGAAAAIGVLAGFEYANTGNAFTNSGFDAYRQGLANETSQEGQQILQKFLSRNPDITVREGHIVHVYLGSDINVPAVEEIVEAK